MDEKKELEGKHEIKVTDRRRFNPDGTERIDFPPSSTDASLENDSKNSNSGPEDLAFPEVNFAYLILSLAGSAQMHLGISAYPSQTVRRDLPQAKQAIDLLGILKDKTKGNLDLEEEHLLDVILSDLRLRYVEEKNKL